MDRFGVRKSEHQGEQQVAPSSRDMGPEDLDTIEVLIVDLPLDVLEVVAAASAMTDRMMRDLARSGLLLGSSRKVLRSLVASAWIDGLICGELHAQDVAGRRE